MDEKFGPLGFAAINYQATPKESVRSGDELRNR